jgi:hypothetical protein
LRGLADDYFGYGYLSTFHGRGTDDDFHLLWRDALGVAHLFKDGQPPRVR